MFSWHKLRVKSDSTMKKNRIMLSHARGLFEGLKDIPYAYIKGEALSVTAYGDFGYRDYHDLDILINRRDIKKLEEIMLENGFEQCVYEKNGEKRGLTRREKVMMMNSHQTAPFTKRIGKNELLEIDVNYDVLWGEYAGKRIDIDELLEDTVSLDLYDYSVRILEPVKNFVQVCLHHYKEMNGVYFFKLKNPISVPMFQDIAMLFKNEVENRISDLVDFSMKHEIGMYIYYMLYYADKIFGDSTIREALDMLYDEKVVEILDCYGLTADERKKWSIDFEERLDHEHLYEIVEPELNEEQLKKIDVILSVH